MDHESAATTKVLLAAVAGLCITAVSGDAYAQTKEVVIGAIYPMSGSAAQVGVDARYAIETAVDIVNNEHKLDLPLAKTAGLPGLQGAKIRVVFGDHQGDPQKGRAEAERMITQEHVVAIIGTYFSSVAGVVGQVAERYQVPFLAPESSSPTLTARGLKWLFRTTPNDDMFTNGMFLFLDDLKSKEGLSVQTAALFYEDTLFGTDSSNAERREAEKRGIKIVADMKYRANGPSLTSEVERIKAARPDVIFPTSYANDAIMFVKTLAVQEYHPRAIIAQDAGYIEPSFLSAVGDKANGLISRGSFALDLAEKRPVVGLVNDLYKARSGKNLTDNTARELQGLLVLADAINRAGTTDAEKVRAALRATDIKGEQTIMPWKGVRFDENGQNTLGTPIMMQYSDNQYRTIWPFDVATRKVSWGGAK